MWLISVCMLYLGSSVAALQNYQKDTLATSSGNLVMTFVGHGTLMFQFGGQIIHIDPVSKEADYQGWPKADLILVTHAHSDHLDTKAIKLLLKKETKIVLTEACLKQWQNGLVMRNGDKRNINGLKIEAIAAYNLVHKRKDGQPFHPKGVGNGYVITFGDKRVYIAGDTENIPEMKKLTNIHVAFLPMNLPYTMTPEMVADAARAFRPKILYPYHFGDTDPQKLLDLLKTEKDIQIRVRKLQ